VVIAPVLVARVGLEAFVEVAWKPDVAALTVFAVAASIFPVDCEKQDVDVFVRALSDVFHLYVSDL
jgi:hypothetical protein